MKKIIKKSLKSLLIVPILVLAVSFTAGVFAVTPSYAAECSTTVPTTGGLSSGANCSKTTEQPENLFGGDESIFKKVTNVLLFIIGAISVIMLIIGGIRYVVSGGDSSAVTSAKNTILYAVVGIIVAILAFALVNFVVGSFVA